MFYLSQSLASVLTKFTGRYPHKYHSDPSKHHILQT